MGSTSKGSSCECGVWTSWTDDARTQNSHEYLQVERGALRARCWQQRLHANSACMLDLFELDEKREVFMSGFTNACQKLVPGAIFHPSRRKTA